MRVAVVEMLPVGYAWMRFSRRALRKVVARGLVRLRARVVRVERAVGPLGLLSLACVLVTLRRELV